MQYPILNEAEAIERICDKDLLKELLVDFSQMKELDWQVFDRLIAEKNFNEIEHISHSIKGVSGNLSMIAIYKIATELNNTVRLGEIDLINRHYEQLKLEVDRFMAFLPSYLAG
jgi:HPt (histidine-containing phosphotransfer) domain-containing protein